MRLYGVAHVCRYAGAYMCRCAHAQLRMCANMRVYVAGRELDVLAAVGTEDEVRGPASGDHRLHLLRREIVSHVADLLLDAHRAVGLQDVPDHGVPPITHICGCEYVSMCGCAVERLRVYAKAPAGASAPQCYQCRGAESFETSRARSATLPGDGSSAAEATAALWAPAAMEDGVLSGLTQP